MRRIAFAVFAVAVLTLPVAAADFGGDHRFSARDFNEIIANDLFIRLAEAQPGGPVAVGSAMAQVTPAGGVAIIAAPKTQTVDASPLTDPLIQLFTALLMGIATWISGAGGMKILSILHLQDSKLAHQVLDEGAKRAVGAISVQLREKFAGKPWTIDAHNEFVKKGGDFLVTHFPDALAKVGVTFGKDGELTEASREMVNDKVEAVLGMLAIDAQKIAGSPHPVIAATTTPAPIPAAPGAPQGAEA